MNALSQHKMFQSPARWWFALAALYLYVAVYRWEFLEGRNAKNSLLFISVALIASAVGIVQSSRDGDTEPTDQKYVRVMRGVILGVLAIHACVGILIIQHNNGNVIDVFTIQTSGVDALLHGTDPYTITQTNIYDPRNAAAFYPPGILVNSKLQFGFPYLPFSLLCAVPGYLLGDVRYSHIVAMLLCAIFLARIRLNWITTAVVCFFLLNPLTFLVERYSWTDAFVVLPLCATTYAAVKRRWWLPIAFGTLLVSKQYAILAIPFVLLLCDLEWKRSLKLLSQAFGVGAIITLPFALWDFRHFVHDTITFFVQSPVRADSLSFAARHPVPFYVIMFAVALGTVFALKRSRRHPAMFAAGFGFVLLIFVCMGKQAFANYYFLIAQAFWCAVVGLGVPHAQAAPEKMGNASEKQPQLSSIHL